MISIVTPTYNRLRNLKLCYQALLKQSVKDFEWIISDDGSTDETKEWVHTLPNEPFVVKYRYIGDHNGYRQCKARNAGVAMADSNSVAYLFLDSDVLLYPEAVEEYLNAYRKEPNRVICGSYWWGSPMEITEDDIINRFEDILDEKLPLIPNAPAHGMLGKEYRVQFGFCDKDELRFEIGDYLALWGGNLLVPKHIFYEVAEYNNKFNPKENKNFYCGYDEHYTSPTEDGDFGLSVAEIGYPVSFNNLINGYHVWHPRNISDIQQKSAIDVVYLNEKHKEIMRSGVEEQNKIILREQGKKDD